MSSLSDIANTNNNNHQLTLNFKLKDCLNLDEKFN